MGVDLCSYRQTVELIKRFDCQVRDFLNNTNTIMKVQIVLVAALVAYVSAAPSDPTKPANTTTPATVTTTKAGNTTTLAPVTTTKASNTTTLATVTTTPASNTTATNPSNTTATTSGASSLASFSSLTIALFALGKYFM